MKPQNNKRSRGHRGSGRRPGFHGRGSTFESNGPEGKIRGTAFQVIEKYQALARDALSSGDRIMAENYFQHAEHYSRVVAANGWDQQRQQQQRAGQNNGGQPRRGNAEEPDAPAKGENGAAAPAEAASAPTEEAASETPEASDASEDRQLAN